MVGKLPSRSGTWRELSPFSLPAPQLRLRSQNYSLEVVNSITTRRALPPVWHIIHYHQEGVLASLGKMDPENSRQRDRCEDPIEPLSRSWHKRAWIQTRASWRR